MVVGAKVCEVKDGFLWFVCGLYVGILASPLRNICDGLQQYIQCDEHFLLYLSLNTHKS